MKNRGKQSRLMRIIAMPGRVLVKARDLYVNSMNRYAERGCYGGAAFGPMTGDPLTRSFSTSSARSDESEDLRELMRAASSRVVGDKIGLRGLEQQQKQGSEIKRVPRSASVGMAKIEEDKPCEFEEQSGDGLGNNLKKEKKKGGLFGRSRSHTVSSTATKRNVYF